MTKKGLGRGFDSLIPTDLFDESFDPTAKQDHQLSDLKYLKLADVRPDAEQPRHHFDEAALDELAASIKEHGLLQPIIVTKTDSGYLIVAGERRYRASKKAGLTEIPALVRTLTAQHKLEVSLIENIQRRDLNPLETATAYVKLRDQFNLTLDQIGARVGGKSVSAVSNTIRLLRLPSVVKEALFDGRLTEGQARPLIGMKDEDIREIIDRIIREDWSARRVEQFVAAIRDGDHATKKEVVEVNERYGSYADSLKTRLGREVRIKVNNKGIGQIIVPFKSAKDFDHLKSILGE